MTITYLTLKTNGGKKISLNRAYKSVPDYTVPSVLKLGINQSVPNILSTGLDVLIPILNGTVCDNGANLMTGSSGGDNTTDNTTTYKQGAGLSDATSQNLIANGTNATKIWTISDLTTYGANAVSTKYIGLWFYIKDATALAKLKSSGTCLEFRLGADSTTNYYSKVYTVAELVVGWNFLGGTGLLSTWTVNGTPGTLNDFQIRITTNNATDTFVAGDVIYDLLRQCELADTKRTINSLTIDESTFQASMEFKVNAGEASGFLINGASVENTDSSVIVSDISKNDDNSKSDTDIFIDTFVDRYI